jgi:serine/threonine-protein kinase HipA
LQKTADAIVADEPMTSEDRDQIEALMMIGTSMGGARPKAVVEDASGLWLAKFNRADDAWNNARVEHAMLQLARACGIDAAHSRVVTAARRDVLLVQRFDRARTAEGYLRARMVSALTLLGADDNPQARSNWSYVLLAEALRRVCAEPTRATAELFRRMCFNALISNTDDHPRNHALIARNLQWMLSPAYDLTPSVPVSMQRRDLAMQCGDSGRHASAGNLLSQCARFLLGRDEARAIIDDMAARVRSSWHATARQAGVSPRDCERIAGAFVYPGFEDA